MVARFGGGAARRAVGAVLACVLVAAAAIYGQVGPMRPNPYSAIAVSMLFISTTWRWLLSSLQIAYNMVFLDSRALYTEGNSLVFISSAWLSMPLSDIGSVDVMQIKVRRSTMETVRICPLNGSTRNLPPGLTVESPQEIVEKVSGLLGR